MKSAYGSHMSEMFIPDDVDVCLSVSQDRKANWWLDCHMTEIRSTNRDDGKKQNSCDQIEEYCHAVLSSMSLGNREGLPR